MNRKTTLFAGLLSALLLNSCHTGAQNTSKMTNEEKEDIINSLKIEYDQLVAMKSRPEGKNSKLNEVHAMPWEIWTREHNTITLDQAIQSLNSARMETVNSIPNAYRFAWNVHKSPKFEETYYGFEYLPDGAGNAIALRNRRYRALSGVEVQIEVHLKDRNGKPIFFDVKNAHPSVCDKLEKPDYDRWDDNEKMFAHRAIETIQVPLQRPVAEVAEGYIDVRLFIPQLYDSICITSGDIGKKLELAGLPFWVEDVRMGSFILSMPYEDVEYWKKGKEYDADTKLWTDHFSYYGIGGGKAWEAMSSGAQTGDLKIVKSNRQAKDGLISFEDWLTAHEADPDHLENFDMEEDLVNKTRWAREDFSSAITTDSVLLVMPRDTVVWTYVGGWRFHLPSLNKASEPLDRNTMPMGDFIPARGQLWKASPEMKKNGFKEYTDKLLGLPIHEYDVSTKKESKYSKVDEATGEIIQESILVYPNQ